MIFVHTLGTALIDLGGARITPASARKFALLLHLSAELGRRVSRGVLRDLIFPDQTEKNARHSLRELVYQLRQRGVDLDADPDGVILRAESVRLDYTEIMNNGLPDAQRLKAIEGGFLPGYAPSHSEAYTEWLEGYRARATFELCKTLLKAVSRARVGSDWLMTEQAARACLALDPLNEEATLALAEMLAVGGAKAQAIGLLDRYVEEVGPRSRGLTLPAAVLRRRIGERLQETYPTTVDFPLLGRQHEMSVLNERLTMARAGESHCVVLHGQPGIGKSRLAREFCSWATLAGWRVERVAVQPNDRERPLAAFVELVPNLVKLPGALGAAPESFSALSRLTKHEHTDAFTPESTDAISAAIVRAISDVIDAVTTETPLILLVEDIHWLDEESLRILAGLVSPRRARRLLVVLTSRERESARHFARHAERLTTLPISGLSPESCTMLVHQSIGPSTAKPGQAFREWLVSASGGNPFYLHALIRHYQTTGQEFTISPTINVLLDQRLATLTAPAMTVLSTCVVLGNHSTVDRLTVALEMPHIELVTVIRELEIACLIVQAGNLVTPSHRLISEAAARNATAIASKISHRRVAQILEEEALASTDADKLWDCAQHWLAAGEITRAVEMTVRCAEHAIEIGRAREAAELLLKAASLTDHPKRNALACNAIRIVRNAGEVDIIDRAAEMVDHTSRIGVHDDIEVAELLAHGLLIFENSDARARLHECVLASEADRNHRLSAGRALLIISDHRRCPGLSQEAFDVLHCLIGLDDQSADPVALKFLVLYHATVGDTGKCGRLARRLIGAARDERPEVAADLLRYAGNGLWRGGEVSEAITSLERAFALAESVGLRRLQFTVASTLGGFSNDLGQEETSRCWMERAERIADEIPGLRSEDSYIAVCFEIAVARGDVTELKRLYDAAAQDERPGIPVRHRIARMLEISIQRLIGTLPDRVAAVHEMTVNHVLQRESGNISDLETAVAAILLEDANNPHEARQTVVNYLERCRRGPAPVAAMLRDAITRLDITELPPWCQIHDVRRHHS